MQTYVGFATWEVQPMETLMRLMRHQDAAVHPCKCSTMLSARAFEAPSKTEHSWTGRTWSTLQALEAGHMNA